MIQNISMLPPPHHIDISSPEAARKSLALHAWRWKRSATATVATRRTARWKLWMRCGEPDQNSHYKLSSGINDKGWETNVKWASEMTTRQIRTELAALNKKIDAFETADDDDRSRGGSPGEGMYERHEELTLALKKRSRQ